MRQKAAFKTALLLLGVGGAGQTEKQLKGNTAVTWLGENNSDHQAVLCMNWTEGTKYYSQTSHLVRLLLSSHSYSQYQDWLPKEQFQNF
jgi:hypothetical protein